MKIILIILSITSWTVCQGQIDWSIGEEFKGLVKTIITTSYTELRSIKSFSKDDTVADYNIIKTNVIQFNGDIKPIKHLRFNNENDTVGYCLWHNDNNGRTIKQIDYRKGNGLERTIEYLHHGDTLTVTKYFDKNGKLYSTWEKQIDSVNYLIRNFEVVNGNKDNDYITVLDSSFLPCKKYKIDSNGDRIQNAEYLYNNNKHLILSKFWSKDSLNYSHQEFSYDEDGEIKKIKEFNKNGKLIKTITKQYNEFGNVIRIFTQFSNNNTIKQRIDYNYDNHGNWTSKKTFFTDWSKDENQRDYEKSKTLRLIEYY